jgi:hypothetical protein
MEYFDARSLIEIAFDLRKKVRDLRKKMKKLKKNLGRLVKKTLFYRPVCLPGYNSASVYDHTKNCGL